MVPIKALRGNPKPRIFPDRTGPDRTETGSGIFFELFSGSVRSGKNITGVDRVGEFLLGVGESLHSVREMQKLVRGKNKMEQQLIAVSIMSFFNLHFHVHLIVCTLH